MAKGIAARLISLLCLAAFTLINFFFCANLFATLNSLPGSRAIVEIEVIEKPVLIPLTADHALYSLLATTDDNSGKQIQELLAYSVFYGKKDFTLNENSNTIDINLTEIIDSNLKYLLPGRDYNLAVQGTKIEFGKKHFTSNFSSTTTLTLPDLRSFEVILHVV